MPKLNVEQKTVMEFLSARRSVFLIPDYQRPYAWTEDECGTLWFDLFAFAFPGNDCSRCDSERDEYFLGPIVTFANERGKLEVIDGQQRLTTLLLLLRAFHTLFELPQDRKTGSTRDAISGCIWRTDELGVPDKTRLKIDSEVASDQDKGEFLSILRTGKVRKGQKSRYARAFQFFRRRVDEFVGNFAMYVVYLPARILNNVILLPIEAESQGTALKVFSTLNDRGLTLSYADIFKAQLYGFFSERGERGDFVRRWKALEEVAGAAFDSPQGNPMDELFTRYMYYERAKLNIGTVTTESLRDFYGRDRYRMLRSDATLLNLEALASFWKAVAVQDAEVFAERVLRRLLVLKSAPNGMWTYVVSVWFMANEDAQGRLDQSRLHAFLHKITAFIWAYAIERPGVNSLRAPVYPELIRIVNGEDVEFSKYRFDREALRTRLMAYEFRNDVRLRARCSPGGCSKATDSRSSTRTPPLR